MANLAQRNAAEKHIVEPPISKGFTKYISQSQWGWITSSGESSAHWAHRDPAHAVITGGE
ncbi:DNA-directed RNA polymerase II 138 kDa polypeptide [Aspergillus luchuensis]|uniref:DNA-directed RNA polymerase II 138 kDa polypeptide n=1 Tax=Aspergillus kawachii TaxID=1069201 RepID=A0A146F0I1_ASPKA|nr:DNA-directed RNA polymerase II 138 kDa polypeptide [Aspergillus luchuensis]